MDIKHLISSGESNVMKEDLETEIMLLKQKLESSESQLKLSIEQNEKQEAEIKALKEELEITKAHLNLNDEMKKYEVAKIIALTQELKEAKAKLKRAKDLVVDPFFNINDLPEEIIIEIFKHFTQNELGQISRVCRRWNAYARSPVFWRKVDVHFSFFVGFQSEILTDFSERLSSSVTHLKLNFVYDSSDNVWQGGFSFKELCIKLKERCPQLHTLIFHYAIFSVSLSSVITFCSMYLPNLKALIIHNSQLRKDRRESQSHPKIKVLEVSQSGKVGIFSQHSISKMPNLKKLNLCDINDNYGLLWHKDNVSFLHQLELLHFGWTGIDSRGFRMLQKHAVSLTTLFLCNTGLNDEDFSFSNAAFPLLETICLRQCEFITCEGIISLIKTCQSMQNIYVDKDVAESYVQHPFVKANTSKLEIVKDIDKCDSHDTLEFVLD